MKFFESDSLGRVYQLSKVVSLSCVFLLSACALTQMVMSANSPTTPR